MKKGSHLTSVYQPAFGLLTDLYQLTMAAGYHKNGIHQKRAIFHLFYRKAPFGGQLAVASGLALVMDLIEKFRFDVEDIQYLGSLKAATGKPLFTETFLHFLQRLSFTGDIYALPEGEIALPHEPILRIEAPLIEAQLLETALLTILNFSTLISTKAARIRQAVGPEDTILEFGLRRAQGIDGGLTASRSAFIGGCDGTSNVWAGRYYGIPVKGTHAHSWVMVFPKEIEAFEAYAKAMPDNSIFLVDTYDTEEGIRHAIEVGLKLRSRGHEMLGVRLDSGDLAELSILSRKMLDEAGFPEVSVVASSSLDEYKVKELKARGSQIDVWGIGTRLATAFDQPALGGVYKLAALQKDDGTWSPRIKRSNTPIKTSNPGRLGILRYFNAEGQPIASQMYNMLDGTPPRVLVNEEGQQTTLDSNLQVHNPLVKIYQNGQQVYEKPSLRDSRSTAMNNWNVWHNDEEAKPFTRGVSQQLHELKMKMLQD